MFQSFKHYGIFLVIALFVGSVLLSNKAGVNLTHHHDLVQFTNPNKVECHGILFRQCDVRLTTEIAEPEKYKEVLELLSSASSRDTIVFYLAGNGGQVNSLVQLVNGIKNTKAKTVSVVEGDVYSAHADLAIATDEMIVGKYINFIFHRSSAFGENGVCDKAKGKTDRGLDAEQKCKNYYEAHFNVDRQLVVELHGRYLTDEEVARVLVGEDVIVAGDDMAKRQPKHGK